jgi:hypothetical protein
MRRGTHPAKGTLVETDSTYHRIVMPVYIPNLEGYFKESFEVLKLSLKSLYTTIHEKSKISVVSNGSCKEVNVFLHEELEEKRIDELLIVKAGIGKINSIFMLINNVKEKLVTLADADVLFTSGWQSSVEQLYIDYPKTGMVCPFSYSKGFRELTSNVYFDNLFNKNIKINEIKNPEALKHFAKSIDNEKFYNDTHLKYGITYQEKGKSRALIGAGHFVATFKREVFQHFKFKSNLKKMASGEGQYIDMPPVEAGLWRLSTDQNFVYHMGNTLTPLYTDLIKSNKNDEVKEIVFPIVKNENSLLYWFKNKIFSRYFFSNKIFHWYLKKKGFSNNQANSYLNI